MNNIILFFEMGYILNLIGFLILVRQIHKQGHVEGISVYTQLLFAIASVIKIFYFPYTILYEYTICWVEYILSSAICLYLLYLFKKYKRLSMTQEKNFFDWRVILVVAAVLAIISNYEKDSDFEWS